MEEGRHRRDEEDPGQPEEPLALQPVATPPARPEALPRGQAPDDERARDPGLYVAVGLVSLLLIAALLGGLFVLPAVAAGFMLRSSGAGRAIGVGLLGLWLLLLFFVGRRLMGARRAPSREAGGGE